MERSILVGVDGSETGLRAVDWAASEAYRRGCRLSLLTAFPVPSPEAAFVWPEEEVRESARITLDGAEERVSAVAPGVGVDRVVTAEGPAHALLHHAEEAAMVVIGLRGRGGFPGLKVGSVAYRVAAHSPTPVTVVGTEPVAGDRTDVVVGVDGSAHGADALAEAFEAASAGSDRVYAVRAWDPPLPPVAGMFSWSADVSPILSAEADFLERTVDPLRARYPSVPVHTEVVESRPVPALVRAAENARTVVVGAGGRHGLPRFALGSTAHGVLHHSPCPVTVVHAR